MRNTKATKITENTNTAVFNIIGTLTGVFEGKSKNYINVRVDGDEINPKTKKPFYSIYSIGVDKSMELFDDDTTVAIAGTINSFFDKEAGKTLMYLTAMTVESI